MARQLKLGDVVVQVVKKDIKNVHLSVHPPTGRVRVAAPRRMKIDAIRLFAISKLAWIKQHQRKLRTQERETRREFIERESHYLWGKRYLLRVVHKDGSPGVEFLHRTLTLHAPKSASTDRREAIMQAWYREQLKEALPPLLAKWEKLLAVHVKRVFVQKMKTKWGSSNPGARHLRLNTELAKKPPECLEYVLLHELCHFISPRHDKLFVSLLDQHLPHWRSVRDLMNSAPLGHEQWRKVA